MEPGIQRDAREIEMLQYAIATLLWFVLVNAGYGGIPKLEVKLLLPSWRSDDIESRAIKLVGRGADGRQP